jgi:peptide/nickel transport system permease protein
LGIGKVLALRGATLFGVLVIVLLILVITLGATGVSDRILNAIISDNLREERQALAQTIRDPIQLDRAINDKRQVLIQYHGLDRPWYQRLPDAIVRVLTLDLGSARTLRTFEGSSKISELVLERLPNTIILVTTASAITVIIGLIIGIRLAVQVGGRLDRAVSYLAAISNALPSWWIGIILILIFSIQLRLFPFGGMFSAPPPIDYFGRVFDIIWHALLPILTLVAISVGGWIYSVRTMVLNTAQEEFVTTARAKGLSESIVMRRHILRAAAAPIVTSIILGLAGSLGGAILTETVFNWPGMGRLFYDAILSLDEGVIVALTFIFTLVYITARFLLEVLYLFLDPRVRY